MVVDKLNPISSNVKATYNNGNSEWVFTSWFKIGMSSSDSYSKHFLHDPNLSGETYYMCQRRDGFHPCLGCWPKLGMNCSK